MSGFEKPDEQQDWEAVSLLEDVTAERDRARSTAVVLEQELAEVAALHMVRVVVDEFGFRGVCSCGWRAPFALADRRDAAASAMVHGMRVW